MNKILNLLGLSRRAGKLILGFDASVDAIKNGTASGLITSCDISEKTLKNLKYEADKFGKEIIVIDETTGNLSLATGKKAAIATVCDQGFWKAIKKLTYKSETTERKDEAQW